MISTHKLSAGGHDCLTWNAFPDDGKTTKTPGKSGAIPVFGNIGVTTVNLGLNFGLGNQGRGAVNIALNNPGGSGGGGTANTPMGNLGMGQQGLADRLSTCFGPLGGFVASLLCSMCSWVLECVKKSCADHHESDSGEEISPGDGREVHVSVPEAAPEVDAAAVSEENPEETHEENPEEDHK